jgi:hypothetical protein
MPRITIKRNGQERLSLQIQGCCGNIRRWQLEYERAFIEQTLRDGGRIEHTDKDTVVIVDRKGRRHTARIAAWEGRPLGAA